MIKTIKHFYNKNVPTILTSQTVSKSLEILENTKSSAVIVLDNKAVPIGIITQRDISRQAGHWDEIILQGVDTIMSSPLLKISEDTDFRDAYIKMTENGFRHLVVVNKENKLLGMLSESDFLKQLTSEQLLAVKTVKLVMTKELITVTKDKTVSQTIHLMNSKKISSIIIVEKDKQLGVFTERDSVHLAREGDHVLLEPISAYMSSPVKTIHQDSSVLEAEKVLSLENIRRLIVVDDEGKLAGIISQHDLLKGISGIYLEMLRDTIRKQSDILDETYQRLEEQSVLNNILNSFSNRLIIACDTNSIVKFSNAAIFQGLYSVPQNGQALDASVQCFDSSISESILKGDVKDIVNNTTNIIRKNKKEYFFKTMYAPIFSEQKTLQGFLFTAEDITQGKENKRILEEKNMLLEEREQQLLEAQKIAKIGNWSLDIKTMNAHWSDTMREITGIDADIPVGPAFLSTITCLDDWPNLELSLMRAVKDGKSHHMEYRVKRPNDGEIRWVDCRGIRINDENGAPSKIVGSFQDITNKKKAELKIIESEALFRAMFEQASLGVAQVDTQTGRFIKVNNTYGSILGLSIEEMQNKDFMHLSHPDELQEDLDYLESLKERKIDKYSMRKRYFKSDGSIVWVNLNVSPLHWKDDKLQSHLAIVEDITKQIAFENKLSQYQHILTATTDLVVFIDKDYRFIMVNDAYLKFHKKTYSQIIGYLVLDVIGKINFDKLKSHIDKALSGIEFTMDHIEFEDKDGNLRHEELRFYPYYDDSKKVSAVVINIKDKTQEYLTKQRLIEREQKELKLLNLIDSSSNEFYVFDKDSLLFTYVNHGAIKNIQYSFEEILKMHAYDLKPQYNAESFTQILQPLIDKKLSQIVFETTHQRKDGTTYPVEVHLQLLSNLHNAEEFLAVIIDITKRKEFESKLKEQEELMIVQSRQAAMGEMINMIAHQWRQPISVVSMSANNLLLDIEIENLNPQSAVKELHNINNQIQYMSRTIDDFRNFFKHSKALEIDSMHNIIRDVLKIIGPALDSTNIELFVECDANTIVQTYKSELQQVIINILSNAKDALSKTKEERKIKLIVEERADTIVLRSYNNGPHIPTEIIDTIFEPYFTTKEKSGGTGLGLYMAKVILQKHMRGGIEVINIDTGVEFIISFPKSLQDLDT